jgi:hypothetical protein
MGILYGMERSYDFTNDFSYLKNLLLDKVEPGHMIPICTFFLGSDDSKQKHS